MNYMDYSIEELEQMLEYPNDIETGCKRNCDDCKEEEIKLIEEAIKRLKVVIN